METPTAKETPENKVRKKLEFIAHVAEMIPQLEKLMKENFEKSPEGKECVYLKKILESFINNIDNFIVHFVSGKPGERGIDEVIKGIEHPDSQVNKDEKLLKELKRLAKDIDKGNIPDIDEWNYFVGLEKEARSISPRENLAEFIDSFKGIQEKTQKFPATEVAMAVAKKSPKLLPKSIILENFLDAEQVWRVIHSRLTQPTVQYPEIKNYETTIARLLKKDAATALAKNGLPLPQEDTSWTNFKAFSQAVNNKGNLIIKALIICGQAGIAKRLLIDNVKNGRPRFLADLEEHMKKMGSSTIQKNIQLGAAIEYAELISSMLKKMRSSAEKERKKFAEIISARIKELTKKDETIRAEIKEEGESFKTEYQKMALKSELGLENMERIQVVGKRMNDYFVSARDILLIIHARLLFRKLDHGIIDTPQLDGELEACIASSESETVKKVIGNLRSIYSRKAAVDAKAFEDSLKPIDVFIDKMAEKLSQYGDEMVDMADKRIEIATEEEALRISADPDLNRSYDRANRAIRTARNSGMDIDHFNYESDYEF